MTKANFTKGTDNSIQQGFQTFWSCAPIRVPTLNLYPINFRLKNIPKHY